jgi:hypothetical protein
MHLPYFGMSLKFCWSRNQALAFANIHQQPLALPHCRGIFNIPRTAIEVQTKVQQTHQNYRVDGAEVD